MRFQLPTVDVDLLTVLRDAVGIAAAHIEENWAEDDWAGVLADLTTLGEAFDVQVRYAERGIRTTIKPLVGVLRDRRGNQASQEAIDVWKRSHPYVRPEIKGTPENSDTNTEETKES